MDEIEGACGVSEFGLGFLPVAFDGLSIGAGTCGSHMYINSRDKHVFRYMSCGISSNLRVYSRNNIISVPFTTLCILSGTGTVCEPSTSRRSFVHKSQPNLTPNKPRCLSSPFLEPCLGVSALRFFPTLLLELDLRHHRKEDIHLLVLEQRRRKRNLKASRHHIRNLHVSN